MWGKEKFSTNLYLPAIYQVKANATVRRLSVCSTVHRVLKARILWEIVKDREAGVL